VVYRDRTLICVACGGEFVWAAAEQRTAAESGRGAPDLGPICRAYCPDDATNGRDTSPARPASPPTSSRVPLRSL